MRLPTAASFDLPMFAEQCMLWVKGPHMPEPSAIPLHLLGQYIKAFDRDDSYKWLRPITLFVCFTGCHQLDAANLLEADIHAGEARLHVKSGRDVAEVAYILDDMLKAIIKEARDLKSKYGLKSSHVFTDSLGNGWTSGQLAQGIDRVWAWLPHVTLDDMKHTFATEAASFFGADMLKAALAHESRSASSRDANQDDDTATRDLVRRTVQTEILKHVKDVVRAPEVDNADGRNQDASDLTRDGEVVVINRACPPRL